MMDLRFPNSATGLLSLVGGLEMISTESGKTVSALRSEADRLVAETASRNQLRVILQGILTSWKERDPGKNGPAYFLLKADVPSPQFRIVVVREFLNEEERVQLSPDAWKDERREAWERRLSYTHVPLEIPIVSLADVSEVMCPRCGTYQLEAIEHIQAHDSAEGDVWALRHWVLCMQCQVAVKISDEPAATRML